MDEIKLHHSNNFSIKNIGDLNKFIEAEEAEHEKASVLIKKSIIIEGVENFIDLEYDDQEGSEPSDDNELEKIRQEAEQQKKEEMEKFERLRNQVMLMDGGVKEEPEAQ